MFVFAVRAAHATEFMYNIYKNVDHSWSSFTLVPKLQVEEGLTSNLSHLKDKMLTVIRGPADP